MKKHRWILLAGLLVIASVAVTTAILLSGGKETGEAGKIEDTVNNSTPPRSTYTNPVFEPVFADPSMIRGKDGYFYAYSSEDDWGDGQGPRLIPIMKSADLVAWEVVGEAFDMRPDWKDEGSLWAPDISFFNDQYYLYYSVSLWGDANPGIGVAVSDNPTGPFEDKGKLFTSEEIEVHNSIDPMLYMDHETPYLFWGSFNGIYGIQLSTDGLTTVGDKFKVAGNYYEAPYIIKRNGYYYFFGSLGSCCDGENSSYRVGVARAEKIAGPYLDREGQDILYSEGTPVVAGMFMTDKEREFVGPGHNAIIQDDRGTDWLIYHAIDVSYPKLGNGATRRPLMIDPLVWKDGWPALNELQPSIEPQETPYFEAR